MDVFQQYADVHGWGQTVVAIGNFDGVHIGHQALLQAAEDMSAGGTRRVVVLTFDPHPMSVVAPHRSVQALSSLKDRLDLLAYHGVEGTLVQTFDRAFAQLSADEFIQRVLVDALKVRGVVVGFNFGFGSGRSGNVETLRDAGRRMGFELGVVDAVSDAKTDAVSSSRIRQAVASGSLSQASEFLGRPHWLTGLVVPGEQRGRTLGFPTANISPEVTAYPPRGVYAGWLDTGEMLVSAVANIGTKPTFHDAHEQTLEVHALDTEIGDVYGRRVRFYFESQIREERTFSSRETLVAQIGLDCDAARIALADLKPPHRFSL